MAAERQPPDTLIVQTNLSGAVTDIDEDPDSAGGDWLTAVDDALDTIMRVSFPTPTGDPNVGAGLQEFRFWVRVGSEAGGNTPTLDVALWEDGSLNTSLQTAISITSYTGEIVSVTWDATLLGTADGSLVECFAQGQRSGGSGANRRTVEFGAVEWNVDYSAGAADPFPAIPRRPMNILLRM